MRSDISGEGCRILLVEDHVDTRVVLSRLLTMRGYRVDMAGTVAEAVAAAQTLWPDVVLADLLLPDGTGIELVGRLRAIRPVRAIALSGLGTPADLEQTRQAGFTAHLTKPITVERLEAVLEQTCVEPTG